MSQRQARCLAINPIAKPDRAYHQSQFDYRVLNKIDTILIIMHSFFPFSDDSGGNESDEVKLNFDTLHSLVREVCNHINFLNQFKHR